MQHSPESNPAADLVARDPGDFPTSRVRRAADAVRRALCAPTLSLDTLRRAVIYYGAAARERALAPDEMIAALAPLVRRCAERRAGPTPELQTYVQWWAIHGYHRAD